MTPDWDRVIEAVERIVGLLRRLRRYLPRKAPPLDRAVPPSPGDRFRAADPMFQLLSLLERQMKYYEKYVPLLPADLEEELESAMQDLERALRPRKNKKR